MPSNSIAVNLELSKNRVEGSGSIEQVPGGLVPKPANSIDVTTGISSDFSININGSLTLDPASGGEIVVSEGFENGTGAIVNNGWDRNSGSTGSSSTGPSSAYEGSYYMYVETSNSASAHRYLTIEESVRSGAVLEFMYHMYGSNMGSLAVEGYNGSEWVEVWKKAGNQGNEWFKAEVEMTDSYNKVRIHSWGASGYRGDAAVDQVVLMGAPTYAVGTSTATTALAMGELPVNVSTVHSLRFASIEPAGTSIDKVEVEFSATKTDPPTEWRELVGTSIPFQEGLDISGLYMWVRFTFSTTDKEVSPIVERVEFIGNNLDGTGTPYIPPTSGGTVEVNVLPASKPQKIPNVLPNVL